MAWSQEQLRNASTIYAVGRSMGMSMRDIKIGLAAALVESNLINVNYGDRDSLGLFQQRPSMGWGTPEQVTTPTYAAKKFFEGLRGIENRYSMSPGSAAQAVQRSAYPGRYDERWGDVQSIWPSVQKGGGGNPQSMDGGDYFSSGDLDQPQPFLNIDGEPQLVSGPGAMSQTITVDPPIPEVSTMLGAWGMDSEVPQAPTTYEIPMDSGEYTFISPASNDLLEQARQRAQEEDPSTSYTKGVDGWRKAVIQAAKSALGVPYVWGGNSLASGVDCSGLVQQAFARAGIDLPRVSYAQANSGKRVSISDLRPGDLVAWDNSSRNNGADHIAIYLGNGQIIEAPRTGLSVRIRELGNNEGAWGVMMTRR